MEAWIWRAYEKNFLQLLIYVDFIKDDKVNIQRFLSGFLEYYRDKIQYDKPRNLKDAIWKENTYMNKIRARHHIRRIGRI